MDNISDIFKAAGYLGWFIAAFIFASFVEYWLHRFMHIDPYHLGKVHVQHHQENTGQGFLPEWRNYVIGTAPIMGTTFLFSWQIGVCCTLGGIAYATFAAYAHQLQIILRGAIGWRCRFTPSIISTTNGTITSV
ncbi:MAG: sterol desaturase family protein [Cyanobacteria bacterium P01_A01_bin.17]